MDNPLALSGKHILVTGASSGIGRATAVALSRLGARLVLTGRRMEALRETLAETAQPEFHACEAFDLAATSEIPGWVAQITARAGAPFDGAVHCAGVAGHVPLRALSAEKLQSVIGANLASAVMLLKGLSARGSVSAAGSSIVLMSSVAATVAWPGMVAYSACKAALSGIARSAAKELSDKNIRVNSIAPAYVRTPMLDRLMTELPDFERIKSEQFLGLIEPDEVATLAAYLLSDAARKITGSQFVIDGGFTL